LDLTDQLSTILLCPTETAIQNLKKEGFPHKLGPNTWQYIINVGDVVYAENTDDPTRLAGIMDALRQIAGEVLVILPLHPRTRSKIGI